MTGTAHFLLRLAAVVVVAASVPVGSATAAMPAAAAPALIVNVLGVRNTRGAIVVSLCRAGESFPGGCSLRQQAPAAKGMTRVAFPALPPGSYAVALFHDEDGDGKLTFIKEGIGFSNDANIAYGPPKFSLSSFQVNRRPTSIVVNIKYLS